MRSKILSITTVVCLLAATQDLNAQSAARITRTTPKTASASGSAAGLAPEGSEVNASGQYSPQDLEDLRTQLMNLTDAVQQMGTLAPSGAVDMSGLQQARTQIQQMPYEQLNTLRKGLSPSKLKTRLDPARAQLSAYTGGQAQGTVSAPNSSSKLSAKFTDSTPFPSPSGFCSSNSSKVNTSSSGIGATGGSGTPPTVSTGTITNGGDQSFTQDPANMRIPTGVVIAADAIRFTADAIREFSQDACKEEILGFNASLVCIAVDALWVIADAIDEGIHFCDDDLTANVIDTSYNGLVDVHNDVVAASTEIETGITSANTDIDTKIAIANTDIDTQITNAVSNLNTHLTTVNNDIDTKIANLSSLVTTLIANLSSQVGAATQQLTAGEQEIMKLLLTPDGLKVLNLAILTCNGSTQPCPAVLATCLANKNCSFNNEGPLP